MSTKLRIAVNIGGLRRFGPEALRLIRDLLPPGTRLPFTLRNAPRETQIFWQFERVPHQNKKLYLFREPAKVKREESKYKQLLESWGFLDVTGAAGIMRREEAMARRTRQTRGTVPRINWARMNELWNQPIQVTQPTINFFGD